MRDLPPNVQLVADVIGVDLAFKLITEGPRYGTNRNGTWKGHVQVYVPKTVPAGHMLRTILGDVAAEKMAKAFGGEAIVMGTTNCIDQYTKRRAIWDAVKAGVPRTMVAEWFALTTRRIRQIVAMGEPTQMYA